MTKHPFDIRKLLLCGILSMICCTNIHSQAIIVGKASYYSNTLHGRKMSNGERYHKDSLTCAHLRLPFGTMLKVRNRNNGKEVIVEVTDRGPYAKKYILDLSRAAARELGIIGKGFAPVEISIHAPAKIPFKLKDPEMDIPEMDLQHRIIAIYPEPLWQEADSTATE